MAQRRFGLGLLLLAGLSSSLAPLLHAQEPFERLTRPVLVKWATTENFSAVKEEVSARQIAAADGLLKDHGGTLLLMRSSQGRWARLLVQPARQKLDMDKSVPILLVERFGTFMDGEERALIKSGKDLRLFDGFRFSLDLGQVVPADVPADFVVAADGAALKIRKEKEAAIWLPSKEIAAPKPAKAPAIDTTKSFGPHWFAGHFQLYDDGRRSGRLEIEADKEGNLSGALFSDKDNKRYELFGKVGSPNHTAQFTVRFPRTEQFFQATIFTGDGSALTGTSRFGERETGFYAKRIDE